MFKSKKLRLSVFLSGFIVVYLTGICFAQGFEEIEKNCQEYVLNNGMKFIVLERHDVPVVSFHTYADVGSANESYGITGISHFLEHMAFKGTKIIGTTDHEAEFELRMELDRIFGELVKERERFRSRVLRVMLTHVLSVFLMFAALFYVCLPKSVEILRSSHFALWQFDYAPTIFVLVQISIGAFLTYTFVVLIRMICLLRKAT